MQAVAEEERRQTATAEEAVRRKLRNLEQEKGRLEGAHRDEA